MTDPSRPSVARLPEPSAASVATPHSRLPRHCAVCGVDWPEKYHGICRACRAGLPCRADTTDTVAPDPPCAGSRARLDAQAAASEVRETTQAKDGA